MRWLRSHAHATIHVVLGKHRGYSFCDTMKAGRSKLDLARELNKIAFSGYEAVYSSCQAIAKTL